MLTETKPMIFPGVHGQAAYCYYQIAFSKDNLRPKVFVLLSHEYGYTNTCVVHNDVSCNHIINKIFHTELKGIHLSDVKIFYKCIEDFQPLQIHKIPFKIKWRPELTWLDKIRLKLGEELVFKANDSLGICGNCTVEIEINTPASSEDAQLIKKLFQLEVKNENHIKHKKEEVVL